MDGNDGNDGSDGHEGSDGNDGRGGDHSSHGPGNGHGHSHSQSHSHHPHTHTAACDTGCCERLEAEGEVAAARLILDGGDVEHAANHVAGAIGSDPSLPEAHEALAELVARVGGPQAALQLFPDTERYTGALACRAELLAAVGRHDEAVRLLAGVMGAAPARPWAGVAWLADPELPDRLSSASLTQAVLRLCQTLGDPVSAEERTALLPFAALVQTVVERSGDPQLTAMACGLARRLGDQELAIRWGEAAVRGGTGAMGAIMLGNALRRFGRIHDAIELWTRTVEQDPSQTYLAVDLAEALAQVGRHAEGIKLLQDVVVAEPLHEKAGPALLGMRYEVDRDPTYLLALADYHRAQPDHDYAAFLLGHHSRDLPWVGRVPGATEACINVLRQLVEAGDYGVSGEMSLSMIEPPSALATLRLMVPELSTSFLEIGDPDPRLAARPVDVAVWRYTGPDAEPVFGPPSAQTAALVRDLATLDWDGPTALYDRAVALAGVPVPELLGVLAHPPAPQDAPWPDDLAMRAPDYWVRAVQTIACVGLAHHRADEPWTASERRRILLDLLDGPEDWVCEAAGMALVAVGWAFPETREEVLSRLLDRLARFGQAADHRPVTVLGSLCHLVLACPWIDRQFASQVLEMLEHLESED
ncbi:MAG: tetratricopeptide repeat protein [Catenulispora sp.]|nr:tetratricopeptide repeat protein [Catenulispora sp.]